MASMLRSDIITGKVTGICVQNTSFPNPALSRNQLSYWMIPIMKENQWQWSSTWGKKKHVMGHIKLEKGEKNILWQTLNEQGQIQG
jgi:hypothetical protein